MHFPHKKFFTAPRTLAALILTSAMLIACGGGGSSGSSNGGGGTAPTPPTPPTPPSPALALFAGNLGGAGNIDGIGTQARFNQPTGITADSAGNLYVADWGNNSVRKITADGVVSTVINHIGFCSADPVYQCGVSNPGIAIDQAGNLYTNTAFFISKIAPNGTVSDFAGTSYPGYVDGIGATAAFGSLQFGNFGEYGVGTNGVAIDGVGNAYVVDSGNGLIRKITPTGVVSTMPAQVADNSSPQGVAADKAGNFYVSTASNVINKISPAGVVVTIAGKSGVPGSADGVGSAATFNNPGDLTVDTAGNVYVADNNTIRKITPAGVVSTLAASPLVYGNVDGTDALARLRGVTTDSAGNVYVVDSGNNLIRKITPTGVVTTIAGLGSVSGYADATGSAAGFNAPDGIGTDSQGNIYVADIVNSTIRKITPAGVVSTFAGKAGVRGSADGTGSAASFNNPTGVATDVSGNVYVADATNSTVRKITPAGVVTTLAGTAGVPGIADGTGPAAQFGSLSGVVTDAAGNVFVADQQTIRKITPGGVVTTLAGQQTPGISGSADGVGAAARFGGITGIATDAAGNIYVTDTQNHTIRKVTQAGVVTTLAGTAGAYGTADGTGPAATFTYPEGITVDGKGNLYVFDSDGISAAGDSGNRIRKITPAGVVTTIVGAPGKLGFASGTLPGSLPTPLYVSNVAISGTSLYITAANGIAVVTNVP